MIFWCPEPTSSQLHLAVGFQSLDPGTLEPWNLLLGGEAGSPMSGIVLSWCHLCLCDIARVKRLLWCEVVIAILRYLRYVFLHVVFVSQISPEKVANGTKNVIPPLPPNGPVLIPYGKKSSIRDVPKESD